MDKREYPLSFYAHLDSQRLKDAFFSPAKEKSRAKKILIPALIGAVLALILGSSLLISKKYEFIVLGRESTISAKNTRSLLGGETYVNLLDKNRKPLGSQRPPTLILALGEKSGVKIDLKDPVDLTSETLLLYLKKSPHPVMIEVVIKDTFLRSNSRSPLTKEIAGENSLEYITVPIELDKDNLSNINLYRIGQINLYFHPKDKRQTNWVLVKDLVLVK